MVKWDRKLDEIHEPACWRQTPDHPFLNTESNLETPAWNIKPPAEPEAAVTAFVDGKPTQSITTAHTIMPPWRKASSGP